MDRGGWGALSSYPPAAVLPHHRGQAQVADTTYATTEDLRALLSIPVGDDKPNDLLQRYLNAAAYLVDSQTRGAREGQEAFSATASITRYFDDYIREDGVIDIDDAVTVTAVVRGGQTLDSSTYYTYPYNAGEGPITRIYLLSSSITLPSYQLGGSSYGYPYRDVGVKAIQVTGTWGYCTSANRPPEIKEATLMQAAAMYRKVYMPPRDVAQAIRDPFKYLIDDVKMLIGRFVRHDVKNFF